MAKENAVKEKRSLKDQVISLVTNRNLILVMFMLTLSTIATQTSKTCINAYGKSLGASMSILGMIATLMQVGKMSVRPFAGRGVDKFDPRKWMIFCTILRAITYVLFASFTNLPMFAAARFLEGVTNAMMVTTLHSLTSLCVSRAEITTAIALYTTFPQLFAAIAPWAAAKTFAINNKIPFYVSIVCLLLLIVLSLFLRLPEGARKDTAKEAELKQKGYGGKKGFHITDFVAPRGFWFLPTSWCNSAVLASEDLLIVVYATEMGNPAAGAMFFTMKALVKLWGSIPLALLADRIGDKWIIYFGFAMKALSFALIAFIHNPAIFAIAGFIYGLGMPAQNALQGQAVKIMPRSQTGIGVSTHLLLTDIGVMIMSTVSGVLCDHMGFNTAFLVFGGIAFCGVLFYAFTAKKIDSMIAEVAES
ncbi:MAG: MFS transporter [Clostridium sp.]|nr:MFS transporter [Clostridium sp.]